MTKFALLADIHERIRLNNSHEVRLQQLARLTNADDAIVFFQFLFPSVPTQDPIRLIAYEAASFYDVVKDMLPDEEPWMTIASESANYGSRDYDTKYVRALLNVEKSFTAIAKQFNEKEARLLWRWALCSCGKGGAPLMTRRTFFGILARIHGLPTHVLQANMNISTIAKVYNQKDSILGLERWWDYAMPPAPMRWKAYTSLAPPEEKHLAVVVPEGKIVYAYNGEIRNRAGVRQPTTHNAFKDVDAYIELVIDEFDYDCIVLDEVRQKNPDLPFSSRNFRSNLSDMNTDEHWDDIVNQLQSPEVRCIRLIKPEQKFKPDAIGGYVMHADRTKVFLRATIHERGIEFDGSITLSAIDGIDDFVPVATTDDINVNGYFGINEGCWVVEVAAVRVSEKGQLINFTVIGLREDLGIRDVTQFTELIERGMT